MTNTRIGSPASTMVAAAAGLVLALGAYLVLAGAPREDHEPTIDDADDLLASAYRGRRGPALHPATRGGTRAGPRRPSAPPLTTPDVAYIIM